ncbi:MULTISPECIES: STY0301 family protein [Dyella]|uniref:DUF3757 domain-containing protein n=2 Tax=Dyella TaxID=231454 RepID=A0A4R0YDQ6_9GAMM|nr:MULTISPECIES: STY0301 family protein [Dyella]TBR36157.1 hypothetical protein EYV96_16315 [Dyella terrae]TCI06206.1 hypothetical protein EZM97_35405 [Dyella soli]
MSNSSIAKVLGLFVLAFGQMFAGVVHAQTCPQSISVAEKLQGPESGWMAVEQKSTKSLGGVQIIYGKLRHGSETNAILRPDVEKDGEAIWNFSRPIGDEELWMRCFYWGSNISLSKRIEPQVQRCTERWTTSSNSREKKFQVSCQ